MDNLVIIIALVAVAVFGAWETAHCRHQQRHAARRDDTQ